MNETRKTTTQDPTEFAHEAMERGAAATKAYTTAASAATIAGLRTAFDLQNGFITAGKAVAEAAIEANAKLADQAIASIKAMQAETTKLVHANAELVSRTVETSKV